MSLNPNKIVSVSVERETRSFADNSIEHAILVTVNFDRNMDPIEEQKIENLFDRDYGKSEKLVDLDFGVNTMIFQAEDNQAAVNFVHHVKMNLSQFAGSANRELEEVDERVAELDAALKTVIAD